MTIKTTATITISHLKRLRACRDQLALFKARWGDSVEVTEALARDGEACAGLDVDWAAENLLKGRALETYEAVRRPAWRAYEAALREAREAFEAVRRPACEAYEAAQRIAFARAYIEQTATDTHKEETQP